MVVNPALLVDFLLLLGIFLTWKAFVILIEVRVGTVMEGDFAMVLDCCSTLVPVPPSLAFLCSISRWLKLSSLVRFSWPNGGYLWPEGTFRVEPREKMMVSAYYYDRSITVLVIKLLEAVSTGFRAVCNPIAVFDLSTLEDRRVRLGVRESTEIGSMYSLLLSAVSRSLLLGTLVLCYALSLRR